MTKNPNNIPSEDIDTYLSKLSKEQKAALEKLRQQIKKIVPEAEEVISYRMPTFRYYGALVGFCAWKTHCSFYPYNSALIKKYKKELSSYKTAPGTIRFTPDKPIPESLINKLVKTRKKENEAKNKAKAKKSGPK